MHPSHMACPQVLLLLGAHLCLLPHHLDAWARLRLAHFHVHVLRGHADWGATAHRLVWQ